MRACNHYEQVRNRITVSGGMSEYNNDAVMVQGLQERVYFARFGEG